MSAQLEPIPQWADAKRIHAANISFGGNFFFPWTLTVTKEGLFHATKSGLFSATNIRINLDNIASIHTDVGFVFDDLIVETFGGKSYKFNGFHPHMLKNFVHVMTVWGNL